MVCLAFADELTGEGLFRVGTSLGKPPSKASVSRAANVSRDSWAYMLSLGGMNARGEAAACVSLCVRARAREHALACVLGAHPASAVEHGDRV